MNSHHISTSYSCYEEQAEFQLDLRHFKIILVSAINKQSLINGMIVCRNLHVLIYR